jgi:hypothetical protein
VPTLKRTTTAQVKVIDLPDSIVDAPDKLSTNTAFVIIELQHAITSRKPIEVKINDQLSTIRICNIREQFKDPRTVHKSRFAIGDIGWFPLLRLSWRSNSSSAHDIHTEYGPISAKIYPCIIVKLRPDCMLGLPISTAGSDGLKHKSESLRARSTYVIGSRFKGCETPAYGKWLNPVRNLQVEVKSGVRGYDPDEGAFVDLLDTVRIGYHTRFEKKGVLTEGSRRALGIMRVQVLMYEAVEP